MQLEPGTRLGHYEVLSALGAGGMGEVWRARDRRLDRDVALKVLPEAFVADPERLARFRREAKVLASLNHPHIGGIYGLEEADDVRALVLELVEGPTLADLIARGPIPIDEALPIARQIAEALEAAHELGIIHRDLKPANIKVRPDGSVKVLDFGLAKALQPDVGAANLSQSPTLSFAAAATQMGVIMGTAPYMSPEQARGKAVDKRADIWAFGCVLYEMLTASRAFRGEDVSLTLAEVMKSEPAWSLLPAGVTEPIRRLLRRCLDKDVRRRLHDIGDARVELEEAMAQGSIAAPPAESHRPSWRLALAAALVSLLTGGLLSSFFGPNLRPIPLSDQQQPATKLALARFESDLSPEMAWRNPHARGGLGFELADLSPDGRAIVYQGGRRLYLRRLDELDSAPLRGTEGGVAPFFSPDGEWVGFFTETKLQKVSIRTGAVEPIADVSFGITGTWGSDGTIVYGIAGPSGLWRVHASGGEPSAVTSLGPQDRDHDWPEFLPGGRAVVFTVVDQSWLWDNAQIAVQSLETGDRKVLIEGGSYPRYAASGHLLYVRQGTLKAVRFDPESLTVRGEPVTVVEKLKHHPVGGGHAQFSVSSRGSLLYLRGELAGETCTPVWVDRVGRERPIPSEPLGYGPLQIDPSGSRLVTTLDDARQISRTVLVLDLATSSSARLTFKPMAAISPIWSFRGERIFFSATEGGSYGLYAKPSGGGGRPELIMTMKETFIASSSSADDSALVGSIMRPGSNYDLALVTLSGEPELRPLVVTPAREQFPDLSPDGRWIAYSSDGAGKQEVLVRPFPNVEDGVVEVSQGRGGTKPLWSSTGREIFFRNGDQVMSVVVESTTPFKVGPPRVLFEAGYANGYFRDWDVAPGGERFLMMKEGEVEVGEWILVQNWFSELERLVPAD